MSRDRVVVVTGASSGIGEAVAQKLLADGMTVIAVQRSAPRESHPRLVFYPADLSDMAATREAGRRIAERHAVDSLVNNAGANCPALLMDATIDELRYVTDITLGAALLLTQALVPGMKERGFGRIVNISSRAVLGKSARSVYASAKAGLLGLTRTVAIETGAHGITVNAVLPGPVATTHFNRGHPFGSVQRQTVVENILVGRVGEPGDVAHAVGFLLDERSGFITGQSLFVCGGTSITGTGGQ
ncbi:3-oxoacyl-[acyl-carrier-protein] reductase FabG [Variovorax sp. PBL-H6]|uniref:SDR family oxidoreductase n=1 Tax=Variovorax sp. PBL-H6 TaxID=434009 RepID=UPI0013180FC6|nr:SDR family oxidoreductase [Variovorax sp. PBL-H6]VTU16257.1 3-oxoacyl-[acyl-carrier-protein] reductase FabG [Variovorax sp. PBL-H6]